VPDVLDSLTREGDRPRADAEVEADGPDRADRDRNVAAAGAVPAPVTGGVRASFPRALVGCTGALHALRGRGE